MATIALLTLAVLAGLLALAYWWLRLCYPAAYAEDPTPALAWRPLPDCEIGRQLQMASAAGPGGAGAPRGGGGTATAGPPRRKRPSGPSRRAFLRNAMGIGWVGVLTGFGMASLGFLWPDLRGGFGAQLDAGSEDEILDFIRTNQQPFEFAPGRTYFVEYDPAEDPDGVYAELTNGAQVMALFWTCVHLGCKVPWCQSSQWLECGCHGSGYNRWGEYREGPAPRGLDRFPVTVEDGQVVVDTGALETGPPRGTLALDQEREGPSCI